MRQAFTDFHTAEYHEVVRFVMRNGAAIHDAQDATQEAFVQVLRKMERGRWVKIDDPRAWTRTVALNHYRQQRRRAPVLMEEPPEATRSFPGHAELTEQAMDVLAALQKVEPAARAVLAYRLDDFPYAAIAAELGLTEQQARDLAKKARLTLSRVLGAEGRDER